jgi:hypothetical protein
MTADLIESAKNAASFNLAGCGVNRPVGESVQMILQWIHDNKDPNLSEIVVPYMEEVLRRILQECEPEQAIL